MKKKSLGFRKIAECNKRRSSANGSITSSVGAVTSLILMGVICGVGLLHTAPVSAAESTLSLAIDNATVEMNGVGNSTNGTFLKSGNSTISASTNNATGYTLKIMATNSSNYTELINSSDNTATLTSITEATSEADFKASNGTAYNGKWGYLPSKYNSADNTSFLPAPSVDGDTLDITSSANSTANTYTLAIGARIDSSVKIGSYSNTYNVVMVANAIPYTITYEGNVVSNMPADENGTTSSSTVALSSKVPVRTGYTFLGWCAGTVTNTDGIDSCSGATYAAGSNYTLDGAGTNALTLVAMWKESTSFDKAYAAAGKAKSNGYYVMQDMTSAICASVDEGQTGTLIDNRDNTTYTVGKLADGKCWFLDNLALDLTNNTVLNSLSSSNTNASTGLPYLKGTSTGTTSDQYATAKVANWTSSYSYSAPLVNMDYKDTVPTDATSTAGGYKIGGYYNYCAASAGSYCYGNGTSQGTSSGNATEDICPAGWRMPAGSTSGEYSALANAIYGSTSSTSDATAYANYRSALHLPLSGYFYNGSRLNQGSDGDWWSSTRSYNNYMYYLYASTSSINPAGSRNRSDGYSVRCVLGS